MTVALADLPASDLVDVCVRPPQTSTRPLSPSEYYPPGTSRTSKVRTGADADRIYNATVGQRTHILKQLEEAERNAQDALFSLEMMEMELARETALIKSALSNLSETLPPDDFEKLCDFAFGQGKKEWEEVWKHEWVGDDAKSKFTIRPSGPSRKPGSNPLQPHPLSSPLPPSSPPPPSSPVNPQARFPSRASPVRTDGAPTNETQGLTHPHSPPTLDGFRTPWGFVDNFGSTSYRPHAPEPEPAADPPRPPQTRRLRRDDRRLGTDRNGAPVIVDPREEIESQRQGVREMIRLQAQMKFPVEAENALLRIVQRTDIYDGFRVRDPPVTWSSVFKNKEPHPKEFTNPFAQGDHVPPSYP